ncbi:hypothetical protein TSUD_276070 [Trifolium subterraneum]|uniref:pyruvate dehydrogenase (acetyl-transferring) n=1 Tax=Trifolium subterraneum TaxID=3900 RepID=A0A2Z6MBS9_TRISU|nr:hypothetical protein TSUD_276070 [Trifolium subterraneum]
MGNDVGHYGGSYKVTRNLAEKLCDLRVLGIPIAENALTDMRVGAAMTGLRPIVKGMKMGSLLLAFNQISNNCGMLLYASKDSLKYRWWQLGVLHSQRHESYFQSIFVIQMVACSTPYNANGLMKTAIRCENLVILF